MDYRARHKMYKGKGKGTGSQRSAVSSNGSSRVASHRTPRSKTPRKRAAASSSKTFLTLTPRVNDPDAEFFVTRIYQGEGMYKGAMRNAQREGLGAFFHINGNRYEGEWQADKAHGHGKMTYKDTSIYDGEWRLGHRHGKGTLTYASDGRAKSYKGQWEDDAQHGVGLFAWHGGESYEGAFVLGAMTGEGRLWFADGYVYHGPFVDGKRHGQGTTTTPDGSKEVAEWRKGKLVAKLVAGDWSSSWINVADEDDNALAPTVAGSKNGQKLANAGSRNGLASLKSRFTILSAAQVEAALEVCEGDATKAAKILEVARTAALIEKAKMAKQLQVAAHASWNSGEALLAAPQFGGASSLVMKPAAPRGARGPKPFAAVSADEYARLLEDPRIQHAAQAPARGAANNLPQPHIRVRRVLHSSQSAVSSKLAGARPKVRGAASAAAEEATKARASFIQEAQRDLRRVKKPNDGAAKAREERAVRRREAAASWAKERNEAGERMKEAAAQAKVEAKKAREAAAIVKPAAARSRDKLKADRTEFERQTIQPDAASACIIDEELAEAPSEQRPVIQEPEEPNVDATVEVDVVQAAATSMEEVHPGTVADGQRVAESFAEGKTDTLVAISTNLEADATAKVETAGEVATASTEMKEQADLPLSTQLQPTLSATPQVPPAIVETYLQAKTDGASPRPQPAPMGATRAGWPTTTLVSQRPEAELDDVFTSHDLPSLAELREALAAGRCRPDATPRR